QPEDLLICRHSPRYVCLGSVYMAFLTALGETGNIVGAPDSSYLFDSQSKTLMQQGRMAMVTRGAAVDVEKILELSPTVVFANRMQKGELHQLIKQGIPVVFPDEFNENTPLGRTEWIRVFGRIAGKQALADSLFSQIVLRYQDLQQMTVQLATNRPTIFGGMEYQGIWYVSGGLSYIAHLYRDSGADYLFDDKDTPASIPLDLEVVLDRGSSADFWRIILAHPDTITYELIAKANRHYTKFSAFQNKKVIACNPSLTAYFEKGILEPDVVLSDLIYALHPELLPGYLPTYYKIIK
ncbi:MAG: ABC transporter substrate-binding protein, partial [Bacteroidia bacterium]|nr:ABC transporter substrate-binding protein [Bacteroidia bacterium]